MLTKSVSQDDYAAGFLQEGSFVKKHFTYELDERGRMLSMHGHAEVGGGALPGATRTNRPELLKGETDIMGHRVKMPGMQQVRTRHFYMSASLIAEHTHQRADEGEAPWIDAVASDALHFLPFSLEEEAEGLRTRRVLQMSSTHPLHGRRLQMEHLHAVTSAEKTAKLVPRHFQPHVDAAREGTETLSQYLECFARISDANSAGGPGEDGHSMEDDITKASPAQCSVQLKIVMVNVPSMHTDVIEALGDLDFLKALPPRSFNSLLMAATQVGDAACQAAVLPLLLVSGLPTEDGNPDSGQNHVGLAVMQIANPTDETVTTLLTFLEQEALDWYARARILLDLGALASRPSLSDSSKAAIAEALHDEWTIVSSLHAAHDALWEEFRDQARDHLSALPEANRHQMLLGMLHLASPLAAQEAWETAGPGQQAKWEEDLIEAVAHEIKSSKDSAHIEAVSWRAARHACHDDSQLFQSKISVVAQKHPKASKDNIARLARQVCKDEARKALLAGERLDDLPRAAGAHHHASFGPGGRRLPSEGHQLMTALPGLGQSASNLGIMMHALANARLPGTEQHVLDMVTHRRRHVRTQALAAIETWPEAAQEAEHHFRRILLDEASHDGERVSALSALETLPAFSLSSETVQTAVALFEAERYRDWHACIPTCMSHCVHIPAERCNSTCTAKCEVELNLHVGVARVLARHLPHPDIDHPVETMEKAVVPSMLGPNARALALRGVSSALGVQSSRALADSLSSTLPKRRQLRNFWDAIAERLAPEFTRFFFHLGNDNLYEFVLGNSKVGAVARVVSRNSLTVSMGLFGGFFELDCFSTARMFVSLLDFEVNFIDAKAAIHFGFEFLGLLPRDLTQRFTPNAPNMGLAAKTTARRAIGEAQKVQSLVQSDAEQFLDLFVSAADELVNGTTEFVAVLPAMQEFAQQVDVYADSVDDFLEVSTFLENSRELLVLIDEALQASSTPDMLADGKAALQGVSSSSQAAAALAGLAEGVLLQVSRAEAVMDGDGAASPGLPEVVARINADARIAAEAVTLAADTLASLHEKISAIFTPGLLDDSIAAADDAGAAVLALSSDMYEVYTQRMDAIRTTIRKFASLLEVGSSADLTVAPTEAILRAAAAELEVGAEELIHESAQNVADVLGQAAAPLAEATALNSLESKLSPLQRQDVLEQLNDEALGVVASSEAAVHSFVSTVLGGVLPNMNLAEARSTSSRAFTTHATHWLQTPLMRWADASHAALTHLQGPVRQGLILLRDTLQSDAAERASMLLSDNLNQRMTVLEPALETDIATLLNVTRASLLVQVAEPVRAHTQTEFLKLVSDFEALRLVEDLDQYTQAAERTSASHVLKMSLLHGAALLNGGALSDALEAGQGAFHFRTRELVDSFPSEVRAMAECTGSAAGALANLIVMRESLEQEARNWKAARSTILRLGSTWSRSSLAAVRLEPCLDSCQPHRRHRKWTRPWIPCIPARTALASMHLMC